MKVHDDAYYDRFDDRRDAFGGHTERALHRAFDLVADPGNWKMPIDAEVPPGADTGLIGDAVIFFTGSVAGFVREGGHLRVLAAGYYACIGS